MPFVRFGGRRTNLEAAAPQVRRACLEGTADQKREKKRGKEDMTRQNV